ncbi:hypothetical protein [Parageobacillus thermoglucosidasius]|uniref:Mobile element protein n=1 Tax=Parageobacillus thermoglucosidasius TaxID=1426 RepID=A0AB38QYS3_PARTM|nr:hypothetical protein [Parageobacillus thermoglucosidasius]UOE75632.1 hypothetical protein IMI45_15150 [Parageobacillus thermoglucosidasius]
MAILAYGDGHFFNRKKHHGTIMHHDGQRQKRKARFISIGAVIGAAVRLRVFHQKCCGLPLSP